MAGVAGFTNSIPETRESFGRVERGKPIVLALGVSGIGWTLEWLQNQAVFFLLGGLSGTLLLFLVARKLSEREKLEPFYRRDVFDHVERVTRTHGRELRILTNGVLFQGAAPPVLGTSCVPMLGCPDNSAKCR